MPVERLSSAFRLRPKTNGVRLIPYLTSGFPTLEGLVHLVRLADGLGVPAVEIGVPYSDSIADGPVIQASFHTALSEGHRMADAFKLAQTVRPFVECALVVMLSYSLVERFGVAAFMRAAERAGYDGVVIPDAPIEESSACATAARDADLAYIGLVAPTTTPGRMTRIAAGSTGFVYLIAVHGTTGRRAAVPAQLADKVAALRGLTPLPICVGFGISTPGQVREVCQVADAAIVGSALVERLGAGRAPRQPEAQTLAAGAEFLRLLVRG